MSEDRLINYLESMRKQYEVYAGGHRREESLAMRDTADHQKYIRQGITFIAMMQVAILGVLMLP